MNAVAKLEPRESLPTVAPDPLMAGIIKAAQDPKTDVEKLERLMALYERQSSQVAERAFNEALAEAQAEMPRVQRNSRNNQTNSNYATLDKVNQIIGPIVAKHGFSLSFGTADCPRDGYYRITCKVAKGGYSRDYQADLPIDAAGMAGKINKTATHAFGSTMSYGRRYLLMMIFNISTTDDDDGNAAGVAAIEYHNGQETISDAEREHLAHLIGEVGADLEKFCRYMKVDSLADLPAHQFDRAVAALAAKKKQVAHA
ncbi:MAG: ERF family protein [Acidobacteriaceae bacterium]|nr:ERF family protein [Acidobacteriaceae bacterium]